MFIYIWEDFFVIERKSACDDKKTALKTTIRSSLGVVI